MTTDVAQTLRYRLDTPRGAGWCMPPLVPGRWADITGEAAVSVLMQLSADLADVMEMADFAAHYSVDRVRTHRPAFYPQAMIVEMQGYGRGGQPGLICVVVHPGGCLTMDGTSQGIHDLNEDMPPDFRTPQSRLDYLHFFTNWVHGSSGRFQPITMPEDLAIRLKPGATLPDALDVFPPRPVPQDAGEAVDGVWIYEMTMLYGDGLFRAKMALEASGTMEMLDDAAVAADLPVVRESMQAFLLVSNVEEDVG